MKLAGAAGLLYLLWVPRPIRPAPAHRRGYRDPIRKVVNMRNLKIIPLMVLALLLGASAVSAQLTTGDLESFAWRNVGPWNFSGRITEFAVPGGQSQAYYVLTASGGLWKTVDGGISFEPIFEDYGVQSMGYLGIAPSNHDILYLGTGEAIHSRAVSRGNGVWKSTDAGKTWTHVGLEKSFFINKVQVHPTNPQIVWVAAEGALYDNEPTSQRGLFKTTDGGQTWTNLWPVADHPPGDFVIDPNNPDIIIGAAYKTFRRTWTFIDRQEGNWLYKTTDGGKNWKRLESGLPLDVAMGRPGLTIFEKNPKIIYARLDEPVNLGHSQAPGRFGFNARSLWRGDYDLEKFKALRPNNTIRRLVKFEPVAFTDERDLVLNLNSLVTDDDFQTKLGVDLAAFNAAVRRAYSGDADIIKSVAEIEKTMAWPASTDDVKKARTQAINRYLLEVLYAPALAINGPITRDGAVYRSDDQGESWRRMTVYNADGSGSIVVNDTEAGYYGRVYVDPNNADVVYLANTTPKISTDGGKTFTNLRWNNEIHVDHRGFWIDPLNSKHILSGNDGAASETWDGGEHWSQKATIPAQQFYDVSADDEFPYNVMGGTQDNGCWIGPSRNRNSWGVFSADWNYLPTGDGFYAVRDWWNSEWIYFESQFGGSSRKNLKTGETTSLRPRQEAQGLPAQRYQWDAPIVLSPHNPGIVYVCSQYVWRSPAHGDAGTWERVSPDLSRADPQRIAQSRLTNLQYATVYTFAESPVQMGTYWAGTDDGNLQVSSDFGKNWTNLTFQFYETNGRLKRGVTGEVIPFDRWVTRVTPSKTDVNTCYVAFSGYRTHNEDTSYLYVTHDLGKSWKRMAAGLEATINDVVEDPDNPEVLYLAADYGLYVSIDTGASFVKMSEAAPDVIIYDLDIQKRERDLVIGTFGRGIYIADIWPFKEFKTATFEKDAHFFEPQRVVAWNMLEQRGDQYGEYAVVPNPPTEAAFYYWLKADVQNVKLVVKNQEGRELGTLSEETDPTPPGTKGLHRVAWNGRFQRRDQGGRQFGGGGGRGFGGGLQVGTYRVTLMIGDTEVATQSFDVIPDPINPPRIR